MDHETEYSVKMAADLMNRNFKWIECWSLVPGKCGVPPMISWRRQGLGPDRLNILKPLQRRGVISDVQGFGPEWVKVENSIR